MAQDSRPFPGVTIGDAGPYSVRDWWDCWGAILRSGVDFGRSEDYNIGVFYAIGNHLEPTENGTDIDVDTGASAIDGLYHENTATVSIDVGSVAARPAANPRIDYIVVRKNFQQAVTYTPANSTATVPPRTARITVIRGTEAAVPVAPSLTQDTTSATYWDIPLATVQVSVAGALSNFTDMREYVDAETKTVLVQPIFTENVTDAITPLQGVQQGFEFTDNKLCTAFGYWKVPADFISDLSINGLAVSSASANIYDRMDIQFGECGEDWNNTTDSTGYAAEAMTADKNTCTLANLTPTVTNNDIVRMLFYRDSTNVLDTINGLVYFTGFYLEYFGWKK